MNNDELQLLVTTLRNDNAIATAERGNIEILSSFVPDSRLHESINNPVDSGIDEG